MQKDLQRDVAFVVNDIHNLPVSVWKASTGQELKYFYDTEGKRIRKDAGSTEYYVKGLTGETEVVVKSDESGATHSILGRDNLGQVKRTGSIFTRYYYLKDHLGTIKMTVDASCDTTGYDDYYPYGQQMDGRCYASSSDARYKYTSKERDAESGYDYFGARYYDARVGRWMSVDPLGEQYSAWGPYVYGLNCPVRTVDPDGRWVSVVAGAVIGGAVEVASQMYFEGKSFSQVFSTTEGAAKVGVAMGAGALSAGASSINNFMLRMAAQGAISASEGAAKKGISGQEVTAAGVVQDFGVGVAANVAGELVSDAAKASPKGQVLEREADRTANISRKDPQSGGRRENAERAGLAYREYGSTKGQLVEKPLNNVGAVILDRNAIGNPSVRVYSTGSTGAAGTDATRVTVNILKSNDSR